MSSRNIRTFANASSAKSFVPRVNGAFHDAPAPPPPPATAPSRNKKSQRTHMGFNKSASPIIENRHAFQNSTPFEGNNGSLDHQYNSSPKSEHSQMKDHMDREGDNLDIGSSPFKKDLSQTVTDVRETRTETQQRRMELRRKKAQESNFPSTRGKLDVHPDNEVEMKRTDYEQHDDSSRCSTNASSNPSVQFTSFPTPSQQSLDSPTRKSEEVESNGMDEEKIVTVSLSALEQLITERISVKSAELDNEIEERVMLEGQQKESEETIVTQKQKIAQLKKEVEDFRFFEELSSDDDDGNHRDGTGRNQTQRGRKITSPKDRVIELQSRLKELETELRDVREENLEYMDANAALVNTVKDAGNGFMNTASAYKDNLQLKSKLKQRENTLADEILARELAETNLSCFKLESEEDLKNACKEREKLEEKFKIEMMKVVQKERDNVETRMDAIRLDSSGKLKIAHDKNDEQRIELEDTCQNLKEGVGIMNTLEEELSQLQDTLDREKEQKKVNQHKIKTLQDQLVERTETNAEMKEDLYYSEQKVKELEKAFEDIELEYEKNVNEIEAKHKVALDGKNENIDELHKRGINMKKNISTSSQIEADAYKLELEEVRKEYGDQLKDYIQQEYMARTELQETKEQLETTKEFVESVNEELISSKEELGHVKNRNLEFSHELKTLRQQGPNKRKDQQFLRDKKKWSLTEQKLRQQISDNTKELSHYKDTSQDQIRLLTSIEELREQKEAIESNMSSMEKTIERYETTVKNNEAEKIEKINRVKSLEQELTKLRRKNKTISIKENYKESPQYSAPKVSNKATAWDDVGDPWDETEEACDRPGNNSMSLDRSEDLGQVEDDALRDYVERRSKSIRYI